MKDSPYNANAINHSSSRGLGERIEDVAEAVIDTVRESLLLLDQDLCIRFANRNFFLSFDVTPEETVGRALFELGNGQWNIPGLRRLLLEILSRNHSVRDFEVTHEFPRLGRKTMCLNAQKLRRRDESRDLILLAIADITERKRIEEELRDRERTLSQIVKDKELLVAEVHHRVKNNLQTVVSLLSLHISHTRDPRMADALSEAAGRVEVIARLHESLYTSTNLAEIDFGAYLQQLTDQLKALHGRPDVVFEVHSPDIVLSLETAVPLGLIANELIVNSLKHAFPLGRAGHIKAAIDYVYDSVGPDESLNNASVQLRVEDDGVGLSPAITPGEANTLGLRIVKLLSAQLHGQVVFRSKDGLKTQLTFLPARVEQARDYR